MNAIKLFILDGENEEDIYHRVESVGVRELVLRAALSAAGDWLVERFKRWQTHQIELEKWCHMGPTTPELQSFRLDLAWTYMAPPWLFYTIIRRVDLQKPATFQTLAGYDVTDGDQPGGRRFLFDSWVMGMSREANLHPMVVKFLANVSQQNLHGMAFSAGSMLARCLDLANEFVGQAEKLATAVELPYDGKEFQSI